MSEIGPILVVDGDESILDLVQVALQGEGFEVIVSQDAERALDLLASTTPSLILLDLWLPDAKGRKFARAYKTYSAERVPLLTMTTGKGATEWVAELGAEGSISKPFEIGELVAIVRKHSRVGTA